MLQGFKDFIARGNVVDLAVGVVIGAAFGKVVTAFVEAVLNPLIGWIFGQPNLNNIWNIGPYTWDDDAKGVQAIQVGVVLTQLLNFVLTAAAIYFFIVLPLNALAARRKQGEEPEPAAPAEDILLLQEIRDLLAARPNAAVANDTGGPTAPPTIPPTTPPVPPS
ncbi:large conductance mechanosensitive channel protein MscL [Cellulomonas sp. JH27-2]|nr:large conductance mechanosensitive channel protein MscL [Cellulomonas sp. JH27-2]